MSRRDWALRTIEAKVRSSLRSLLAALASAIKAIYEAIRDLIRALTGAETIASPRFYEAYVRALESAGTSAAATLEAGWRAAVELAIAAVDKAGAQVDDGFLRRVLDDVAAVFADLRQRLLEAIRDAHDANDNVGDREQAVGYVVDRLITQARVRVDAAGVVVVHRGYTAGQAAAHTAQHGGETRWRKIWQTTSDEPCPACQALDGTSLPVSGLFDAHATVDPSWTPPRVFYDLAGPPRHPNCRCRLLYVSEQVPVTRSRRGGRLPQRMRAADIRTMATSRFETLLRTIETVGLRAVRRLGRRS